MNMRVYLNIDIEKMKVSEGKLHDYLGMNFYYSEKGQVKVKMLDYIK